MSVVKVRGVRKVTQYEGCLGVPGRSTWESRDLQVKVAAGLSLAGEPLQLVSRCRAACIFEHE